MLTVMISLMLLDFSFFTYKKLSSVLTFLCFPVDFCVLYFVYDFITIIIQVK